jgi:hypothetical protein
MTGFDALCSWLSAFKLAVLKMKNLPAALSNSKQHAANICEKSPLEELNTLPAIEHTRFMWQSA